MVLRNWKSEAIHDFLKKTGYTDPEKAIISCAQQLFKTSHCKEPPIDVYKLAEQLKITIKEIKGMSLSGRLIPVKDGFVMEIKKDDTLKRKRFTCAHELSHLLLLDKDALLSPHNRINFFNFLYQDKEIEYLCDLSASEILMPSQFFMPKLKEYGVSVDTILTLSDIFETSIQSIAVRIVKMLGNYIIIIWKFMPKPGAPEDFRVNWCSAPKGFFIPRYASANISKRSFLNSINEAYCTGKKTIDSRIFKHFGNLNGLCYIESMRLNNPNYVLSVIKPNKYSIGHNFSSSIG